VARVQRFITILILASLATDHCSLPFRQLAVAAEVPTSLSGVCSSRAFLIHKWMAIHAFIKGSDPVRGGRGLQQFVYRR
jgi:hypothetical protein